MARPQTVLLVAGEASGDLHAARLVRAILSQSPGTRVLAVGGEQVRAAGATLLHGIDDLAVVGITEVLRGLPRILRLLRALAGRLRSGEIDLFLPVDFPDFNFRLASVAHRSGVPVFYFIAPQVWAWRTGRLRQMASWCHHIAVLFPFEVEVFEKAGIPVTYAGHPLVSDLAPKRSAPELRTMLGIAPGEHLVALLPGSRRSEVHRHLGVMAAAVERIRARGLPVRAAIARAPTIPEKLLRKEAPDTAIVSPPAFDLAAAADLVLCASGTATVETALAGTPMVVMYRLSPLTWLLARRLVRSPHIAMANLVAGERLVPELLQGDATPDRLAAEAVDILKSPERQAAIRRGYARVREALSGGEGIDSVAQRVLGLLPGGGA